MRIAVIVWGSIVWDRRNVAIAGNFEPIGPRLPIEFSRVSGDGRLTLVVDEGNGVPCWTYSALSALGNLDAAIENLRVREGMPNAKGVGFIDRLAGRRSANANERHPRVVETIDVWAAENGYDGAI